MLDYYNMFSTWCVVIITRQRTWSCSRCRYVCLCVCHTLLRSV